MAEEPLTPEEEDWFMVVSVMLVQLQEGRPAEEIARVAARQLAAKVNEKVDAALRRAATN